MPHLHLVVHLRVILLACSFLALSSVAFAGNEALVKLLGLLRDRGSITAQEYGELVLLADPAAGAPASAAPASGPAAAPAPAVQAPVNLAGRVEALEKANKDGDVVKKALAGKWYEKLGLKGYTQFRYSRVRQGDGELLEIPNDRSVNPAESLLIRRGRFTISGDVSSRLAVYAQTDFQGSTGSGDFAVQARDLYADVALDAKKAWRVRAGLSKVPYGFSNMQSSQNRLALERPDAINSAAEGERDFGAYLMWASPVARQRFKDLANAGLKGSGDYGVVTAGVYSGQGLNRSDLNGDPHVLGRVSYPFRTRGGQFWEVGVQGYTGRYVTTTQAVSVRGVSITPSRPDAGVTDQRVGVSAVVYPQPFGLEAEWNWGRGPTLASDYRTITARRLNGGYLQGSYRYQRKHASYTPFVRWQYFDGGRKFARNSPLEQVNETEAGLEWAPIPDVELTVLYGHTVRRTRSGTFPYAAAEGANRIGIQFQFNY